MKIELTKNIKLHSALVYLRFQKEEFREDIQEYLNRKSFKPFKPLIEDRIKDYLKNIGIYDERSQLTNLGNKVKNTGKIFVSEEGKYQIWFTKEDSFFGSKIFYFKRLQPISNQDNSADPIKLDKDGHFLLPTNNNEYAELKLISDKVVGNTINNIDSMQLSWIWENLEKSYYIFNGELGKGGTIKIKNEKIPSDKDIKKIISENLSGWNEGERRRQVRFDDQQDENRRIFEEREHIDKWNEFDVQIQNLPLMPYDKEDAKKWRDWLLTEELKKEYFGESDFQESVEELNRKKALAVFNLGIPEIKEFAKKTKSKKVFWHLNAPMDLNPNTKIKHSAKNNNVPLQKGERVSFADIVSKLELGNTSLLVYYDQYVCNYYQQRAVSALIKAVNSERQVIVTDIEHSRSDFIKKNMKEITLIDCKTVFKERWPHDRYLIAFNQNGMSIWNISNSIDYIKFPDKTITETTVGTIQQSVVFTQITKEMIDKDLLNFINNEVKNAN